LKLKQTRKRKLEFESEHHEQPIPSHVHVHSKQWNSASKSNSQINEHAQHAQNQCDDQINEPDDQP
jgi:hypothetical protein